jgi:hypothetical protein
MEFSANITANPEHAQARAWESGQQPLKTRQNLNSGPSLKTHHCCRLLGYFIPGCFIKSRER